MPKLDPKLKQYSRNLRNDMTKEEKHLWYDYLKDYPVTIKRQKVFDKYIVDFYCAKAKLAIELDGSQHYEKEGHSADLVRDKYLADLGIKILRYSNYDINNNFVAVCEEIDSCIKKRMN